PIVQVVELTEGQARKPSEIACLERARSLLGSFRAARYHGHKLHQSDYTCKFDPDLPASAGPVPLRACVVRAGCSAAAGATPSRRSGQRVCKRKSPAPAAPVEARTRLAADLTAAVGVNLRASPP